MDYLRGVLRDLVEKAAANFEDIFQGFLTPIFLIGDRLALAQECQPPG